MATDDRKARLLQRNDQIEAQLADLEARANVKRRRIETRLRFYLHVFLTKELLSGYQNTVGVSCSP
jgi:hypothetical protein